MTNDSKQVRRSRLWGASVLLIVALAVLPAGYVSVAEERDVFCTACHLKPEQTYYERSLVQTRKDAPDLATAHAQARVNCVGCHRGDQGGRDRTVALALGARNTAKFVSGQYDPNHTQVVVPSLLEDSCWRCHVAHPTLGGVEPGRANRVTIQDFDNHFHSLLFDPKIRTSVTCTTCHLAHREAFPEFQFMDRNRAVLPACERCHQELERGPAKGLQ